MLLEHTADRVAGNSAKKPGLQVVGTSSELALAKYTGLIREAKPDLDKLVENGSSLTFLTLLSLLASPHLFS